MSDEIVRIGSIIIFHLSDSLCSLSPPPPPPLPPPGSFWRQSYSNVVPWIASLISFIWLFARVSFFPS